MGKAAAALPIELPQAVGAQGTISFTLAGLPARRKGDSRERLLVAAAAAFCADGYFAVSIEDIASAAGVSRMTFYRHFSSKVAIAIDLFQHNTQAGKPRLLSIGQRDYHNRAVVIAWIAGLFADGRKQRQLLRAFMQVNVEGAGFTEKAHAFIEELIVALGVFIPAFALDAAVPAHRRRHIEAWLLLYELLDQSNHAARDSGVATDPLIVDILADRFLSFLNGAAANLEDQLE